MGFLAVALAPVAEGSLTRPMGGAPQHLTVPLTGGDCEDAPRWSYHSEHEKRDGANAEQPQ